MTASDPKRSSGFATTKGQSVILFSRSLLLVLCLIVSNTAFSDEPRRVIDHLAIQNFIEWHKPDNAGPGKVIAITNGLFDSDYFPDKLVVYTYERKPTSAGGAHGLSVVAFLTEDFGTTDALFIPATEVIPESVRRYSSDGKQLVIWGKRHLPSDEECCPSVTVSIALWVVDGEVVVLESEFR